MINDHGAHDGHDGQQQQKKIDRFAKQCDAFVSFRINVLPLDPEDHNCVMMIRMVIMAIAIITVTMMTMFMMITMPDLRKTMVDDAGTCISFVNPAFPMNSVFFFILGKNNCHPSNL